MAARITRTTHNLTWGKIVVLGGHPTLGISNTIEHTEAEQMIDAYYPRAIARQSLWAAQQHYERGHFTHTFYHVLKELRMEKPVRFPSFQR